MAISYRDHIVTESYGCLRAAVPDPTVPAPYRQPRLRWIFRRGQETLSKEDLYEDPYPAPEDGRPQAHRAPRASMRTPTLPQKTAVTI